MVMSPVLSAGGVARSSIRVAPPRSSGGNQQTASSVTFVAPSGTSNNITATLDKQYTIGNFADGSPYVLTGAPGGSVTVSSKTPSFSSGRNGHMVNPPATPWNASQSWSTRAEDFTSPPSLPLVLHDGDSLVLTVSTQDTNNVCANQFAGVLTVLDTPPAANSFRPPYIDAPKTMFSADDVDMSLFNSFAASAVPHAITLATAQLHTKHQRLQYHGKPTNGDFLATYDANGGVTWGGDAFKNDMELLTFLHLDAATEAEKLPLVIGYVQFGIDQYAAARYGAGFYRGGGGNGAGLMLPVCFAAAVLDNTEIKDWLANDQSSTIQDTFFWELRSIYRSSAGVALWGQPYNADSYTFQQWEDEYWDQLDSDGTGVGNGTTRDPYGLIDGGSLPGQSYMSTTMHQCSGVAALFDVMPELKAAWPTVFDNAQVMHEYGHRITSHGCWCLPDDAAPKDGNESHYKVTYGPTGPGNGVYITGSGRVPDLDGDQPGGGNRFSQATQEFIEAYGGA